MNYRAKWIICLTVLYVVLLTPRIGYSGVFVTSGLAQILDVESGQTYTGQIAITNSGEEVATVKLYQTDFVPVDNGGGHYPESGTTVRSNADWTTLSLLRLSIPPRGSETIEYRINTPNSPDLEGSYWSIVFVQSEPEVVTETSKEAGITLRQQIRYAVLLLTSFPSSKTSNLKIHSPVLSRTDATRVLEIGVRNTGDTFMAGVLSVELHDESGASVGKYQADHRRKIYPGVSRSFLVDLVDIPSGVYRATVIVDAGGDYLFGARYKLRLK